ncbi:hypothetical protein SRS16P2_00175 (plasmid) [Variovorax sp. SRS16]|uniref:hypothetical protein n=1 Tax=Variovorax sp. SRS16 TaxID=282217 RepID=UPI001315BDA4|nr:hypothetical protein [Variovorax sp. SRS16]VTU45493.1 hypothetical protein SRS16P2_00175 [Variovorax sp. SRS16]
MSQLESALKRLAEGRFVCATRYPDEYDALSDPAGQRKAEEWLSMIGYRLARLSDEGAFFMAHAVVTTELRTRVRAEMKNVRGKLEPMVKFLETIRRTQGRNPHVHAGDMLWGTEISEVARSSARLEHRVTSMHEISGARVGDSVPLRVERMLDQMVAEGYLVASHPQTQGYTVTGKIDYLYQLIDFIAANTSHLSDEDVVDQLDPQARIDQPPGAYASNSDAGDVASGGGPSESTEKADDAQ